MDWWLESSLRTQEVLALSLVLDTQVKSLNLSKPPVLGKKKNKSLKRCVLLQISYIVHTFYVKPFMLNTVNMNHLKHFPARDRSLRVLMFREHIPGTSELACTLCCG